MRERTTSRRNLLGSGACALTAAAIMPELAGARARAGLSSKTEQIVRNYYGAWEKGDWQALDSLLTDDFTFTSPDDDHDSKSIYKARCWAPNVGLIRHFDLQQIAGNGDDAFVMYVLHIKNGKKVENIEYLHLRDGRVASVRCYFGQQNSYPAAQS
jgi:ketosteroid isomerase-like protein